MASAPAGNILVPFSSLFFGDGDDGGDGDGAVLEEKK